MGSLTNLCCSSPVASELVASVVLTLGALTLCGYRRRHYTDVPPWRSALQTVLIGGVAAGIAFGIARAIS
jgi:VIT1/CCC1 family predicted Fe2+/Mn2+ transporter